jgi:cytochrome P450
MVNYSTLAMQRREELYPEPSASFAPVHEFSPERWGVWTPRSWQYVPFNGGPRICIGQQFALTEMAYVTTRILQRFGSLEYRGDGHPGMKTDIVLAPARAVPIELYEAEE